jgi:hypothetical protein
MKEKIYYQASTFSLPKSRAEREVSHSGRIRPDYRLQPGNGTGSLIVKGEGYRF